MTARFDSQGLSALDRERGAVGARTAAPRTVSRWRMPPLMGVLLIVTLCVWGYILARAVDVAFTTDESVSYGLFHGMTSLAQSANNQWLNTIAMQFGQTLFGQAEWALRLPNVLSFAVYGAAALWLIRALRTAAARLFCFALLLGDPFMLEFFGLARGYGMSVAFSAAALVVLLLYPVDGSGTRALARFGLVGLLAALGFYANFSVLNYVLAVLAGAVIDTVVTSAQGRLVMTGRHWLATVAIAGVIAAALVPGVLQVMHLNADHDLYYGGFDFVRSTVGSLVMTWGYVYAYAKDVTPPDWALIGAWTATAVAVLALLHVAVQTVRQHRWSRLQVAAVVLIISVVAVLIEHAALGTRYPIDRTALSYVLVFAALLGLVVDDLFGRLRSAGARHMLVASGALVALLGLGNMIRVANLTSTLTWRMDASSRAAVYRVMALERTRPGRPLPWNLAVVWPREYALTYYKTRFGLRWLNIVTEQTQPTPIRYPSSGYVDEVPVGYPVELPAGSHLLARLPPDGTELYLHRPSSGSRAARLTDRRSGRSRRA